MHKINWQLLSDGNVLINNQNVDAKVTDEFIIYEDEFGTHSISKLNSTYQRIGKEDEMFIDFNKKNIIFKFDGHTLSYDIETSFEVKENIVKMSYNLGDEEKTIIVTEEI